MVEKTGQAFVPPDVTTLEGAARRNWILRSGWFGRCPRCGQGKMFASWLNLVDSCAVCRLDYRFATPDDGPAFFALCIGTFPTIFFAMWIELRFEPPVWVHAVTTLPMLTLPTVAALRPIKGWLVASQFVNRAQEAGTEALADSLQRAPGDTAATAPKPPS